MNTVNFGRDERERDPLLRKIAALPAGIEPSRDLWPGIRTRLEQAPPASAPGAGGLSWSWALAAGVAVASVSALFTWMAIRAPASDPVPVAALAPVTALQPVSIGGYANLGPEYAETRATMLALFQSRLATLPEETRLRVEENLAIIQKAASDIDAALAADPSSKLLNRLLLSTYQEEMRLYTTVAEPGEAGRQRT
jgi:hypothetical protein